MSRAGCGTCSWRRSPRANEALRSLGEVEQRDAGASDASGAVLAGRQDVFTWYDSIEASLQLLQNGREVEFADCGHAPFLEYFPRYKQEFLAFVNEV